MLIYVKIIKKRIFIGRTDGRSTQNYSSEPHKIGLTLIGINVICEVPFYNLNYDLYLMAYI